MKNKKSQLAKNWLKKAESDLGAAGQLMKGETIFPDSAIYHCQQAAEKALKAFLAFKDYPLQKIHDLTALVDFCSDIDEDFQTLKEKAELLTPYATAFRYPSEIMEPEQREVFDAIVMAEDILNFVKSRIAF